VPRHVAIVMDGSGRWAQRRGLARTEGHGAGEESLVDTTYGALAVGVKALTVFAFPPRTGDGRSTKCAT